MSFDRSGGQRSVERRREALREIREELERLRRAEARVTEGLGSLRAARHRVEELVRTLLVEDDAVRTIVREELSSSGGVPGSLDPSSTQGTPNEEEEAWRVGGESLSRSENTEGARRTSRMGGILAGMPSMPWAPERTETDLREGKPEPAYIPVATPRLKERRMWLAGIATVSALVFGGATWLAVQAFKDATPTPTLTIGGDSAGAPMVASAPAPVPADTSKSEIERFFIRLPDDPTQRGAVYDSLWQARSPMFASMVDAVESGTDETDVKRAASAWDGGDLTPLQLDILHSALVQLALREEAGSKLALDGQLLRNPCRGASCTALMDFWKTKGAEAGLPEVPADAAKNTRAMHIAESVLVLKAMEDRALKTEISE